MSSRTDRIKELYKKNKPIHTTTNSCVDGEAYLKNSMLSFPANEPDPDTGTVYIGDVIISVDRAQEQAQAGGHPLQAELQLLIVHGVLHLLGHDHADLDQKNLMWAAQSMILSKLGIAGIKIS